MPETSPRRRQGMIAAMDSFDSAASHGLGGGTGSDKALSSRLWRGGGGDEELMLFANDLVSKMEAAASREDYDGAAAYRDELKRVEARLSPSGQFMRAKLLELRRGSLSPQARAEVIGTLGRTVLVGNDAVLESLASHLHDSHVQVHEGAESALWQIFQRSGRPEVDKKLQEGVLLMQDKRKLDAAEEIFSHVCDMCPTFAEGYNKRATVRYIKGSSIAIGEEEALLLLSEAVQDCNMALELNRFHFGASSGAGLCYTELARVDRPNAERYLRSAIESFKHAANLHPHMQGAAPSIVRLEEMLRNMT